jgi:hypothetical protein
MMITTLFLALHGHASFRGGVIVLLLIALVSLIVAFWPAKSGSK